MSEYACIVCIHGPHTAKICPVPNCGCPTYTRADVQGYRAMVATNTALVQGFQLVISSLIDIVDLLCEMDPEAASSLAVKREQAKQEAEEKNKTQNKTQKVEVKEELNDSTSTANSSTDEPITTVREFRARSEPSDFGV